MNVRLIVAFVTSLLDEAIILALILWGLPKLGVSLSLFWTVLIVVFFAIWAVVTFRIGTRALSQEPVIGLSSMVGTQGKVASRLSPEGFVIIKGELWLARSETGEAIGTCEEIVVTGQKGLKLTVRKTAGENI